MSFAACYAEEEDEVGFWQKGPRTRHCRLRGFDFCGRLCGVVCFGAFGVFLFGQCFIANVEIGEGQELQSVRYTAPEEAINSGTWLYSDTDVEECENLTLVYNFTFTGVTSSSAFTMAVSAVDSKSGVMFESQFGGATREASYSAAVEAGYIVDASEASIEVDLSANSEKGEISYSTSDGVFSFSGALEEYFATVTIQFSWGEIFGYENPYFTYVGLTDAEERAAAADTIDYIAACLEGVTYSITFEPIVNQG